MTARRTPFLIAVAGLATASNYLLAGYDRWIALVEGVEAEALSGIAASLSEALAAAGATVKRQGLYRLQFDLSKAQLG